MENGTQKVEGLGVFYMPSQLIVICPKEKVLSRNNVLFSVKNRAQKVRLMEIS